MLAATPIQLDNIVKAIDKLNAYIAHLQSAQHDAAVAGKMSLVQQLSGPFWDANSLEERLVGLRTMTDIDSLNGAITSLKQTTDILNKQKKKIDAMVKAVDTAATVINDIAAVAGAIATL
jgi:division protein CdvB (Snf7/Vps24/ESCRT-III family)